MESVLASMFDIAVNICRISGVQIITESFIFSSRFGVDLTAYPTIAGIKEALEQLPPFIAADFKNQPDTPDDLKA